MWCNVRVKFPYMWVINMSRTTISDGTWPPIWCTRYQTCTTLRVGRIYEKKIYGPRALHGLHFGRTLCCQPRAFRSKLRSASSAWCWARPSRISSSRASRMPRPPRAFQPGISSPVTTVGLGETTGCSYSTQGLLMRCRLFPLITNYLVSICFHGFL